MFSLILVEDDRHLKRSEKTLVSVGDWWEVKGSNVWGRGKRMVFKQASAQHKEASEGTNPRNSFGDRTKTFIVHFQK